MLCHGGCLRRSSGLHSLRSNLSIADNARMPRNALPYAGGSLRSNSGNQLPQLDPRCFLRWIDSLEGWVDPLQGIDEDDEHWRGNERQALETDKDRWRNEAAAIQQSTELNASMHPYRSYVASET